MSDKIREAFEKFAATHQELKWYDTEDWDTDAGYGCVFLQLAYEAWQAALAQQPAPAVPKGWKLLPIKPEIEMVEAGYEASLGQPDRSGHARAIEVYDAMLAASPAAPVAVGQELVEFDYPEYHEQGMGCGLEDRGITDRYEACRYGFQEAVDQCAAIVESLGPLYAAPPAAEQPDTVKVNRKTLERYVRHLQVAGYNNAADDLRGLLAGGEA